MFLDGTAKLTASESRRRELEEQQQLSRVDTRASRERYQSELMKFHQDKLEELRSMQALLADEKRRSEELERALQQANCDASSQSRKINFIIDWLFKTYSGLIITKSSPTFNQGM